MEIQAIAFDVNGTLVEILTEDDMEQCFRAAGHFLTYQGVDLRRQEVRALYFRAMKELACLGYFSSEIGCTQAVRYIEVPGAYHGDVPYKKGDPAWY